MPVQLLDFTLIKKKKKINMNLYFSVKPNSDFRIPGTYILTKSNLNPFIKTTQSLFLHVLNGKNISCMSF